MNTNIQSLLWDSEFFGIKIGKITVDDNYQFDDEFFNRQDKDSNFDLIYCFVSPLNEKACRKIETKGAKLVDEKVVFQKELKKTNNIISNNIYSFNSKVIPKKLYQLAIESGKYSRYRTDSNFSEGAFEKFYYTWLNNSISKQIADETFTFIVDEEIVGFATLKLEKNIGIIGLIAVDENSRGNNIGTSLMQKCENTLIQRGIYKLEVATQKANNLAMQFYTKNDYSISNSVKIYHLWRQ